MRITGIAAGFLLAAGIPAVHAQEALNPSPVEPLTAPKPDNGVPVTRSPTPKGAEKALAAPTDAVLSPPPSGDAATGIRVASGATDEAGGQKVVIGGFRVSGVQLRPQIGITPTSVDDFAREQYRKLVAEVGTPTRLSFAQVQSVANAITDLYRKVGFKNARASLPGQVLGPDRIVRIDVNEGEVSDVAVGDNTVPALRERGAPEEQTPSTLVNGIRVTGVASHPELGVTPVEIGSLADALYRKLAANAGTPVKLTFAQLQSIADGITERYKKAGFIVARAFLPAQTIDEDKIVRIDVLEGAIGKIIVKGNKRYRAAVIAAPAEKLKGKPLLKDDVDSALLYDRDLPGVSVSATFQPGANVGETDLVILANEAARPFQVTVGGTNYGTSITGRYRAQLGLIYNNLFGIGDQFNGRVEYAVDPTNNIYGAVSWRLPTVTVPGLASLVGATRNQLQINTGSFAALDISGPTSSYFGGAEWKFINAVDLQVQSQFLVLYEQSKLRGLGSLLSNEKFTVASLKLSGTHTDRRFNGIDILELGARKSITDNSNPNDVISPNHASNFLVGSLSYTRLQYLTKSQRLVFKAVGQYTDDALIPLEQFVLGGPDSVRAYPIADSLRDRGYYTALEYHVDAPGFGSVTSPFYGRPWRELIEFEAFADYARGFSAGGNRSPLTDNGDELSGIGGGLIFRIPKAYAFQFHLQGAVPLSAFNATDGNDYHIYGQFSFTY